MRDIRLQGDLFITQFCLWNLQETEHRTSRKAKPKPGFVFKSNDSITRDFPKQLCWTACLSMYVSIIVSWLNNSNELWMCNLASSCQHRCGCMLDIACDHVGCVCPLSPYVFINYIKEHQLDMYLSIFAYLCKIQPVDIPSLKLTVRTWK